MLNSVFVGETRERFLLNDKMFSVSLAILVVDICVFVVSFWLICVQFLYGVSSTNFVPIRHQLSQSSLASRVTLMLVATGLKLKMKIPEL